MSPFPALSGLRIGCVKYLNSKPLIAAYPGSVIFDHPSRLAAALHAGEMDAALVPVFEAFSGEAYVAVDGVAIASHGPVYSVFLAYEGELKNVHRIALDPASLTSAHLVQVLLREFYGVKPICGREGDLQGKPDARLLIGNQAIEYRRSAPAAVKYLDLGEEWTRQTGLPFVFAVWLMRAELEKDIAIAQEFRRLKEQGLKMIPEIASREGEMGEDLALRYLTEHIRFDLGAAEKQGIARFQQLLVQHELIGCGQRPLRFV